MTKVFEGISKRHWIAGLLLTLVVIGWVAYQQWLINQPIEVVYAGLDPKCDLRAGPCETILDDGSQVSFAIEPRSLPISKPLKLIVTVSGMEVDGISVDTNGVEMKMPPNIVNLKRTGNGHYDGIGALSFCTRGIMEWESIVQITIDSKQIKVPYRFITSHEY